MPIDKINILLVDNGIEEAAIFDLALSKLEMPYTLFTTTECGGPLYDILRNNTIHIIFLDINMPGKNGLACLSELKANKTYQHIPVVIYSVSARKEDIEKAWKANARYYLVKPYSQSNLIESLRKIFVLDYTIEQPVNTFENFVINLAFA